MPKPAPGGRNDSVWQFPASTFIALQSPNRERVVEQNALAKTQSCLSCCALMHERFHANKIAFGVLFPSSLFSGGPS